MSHVIVPTEPRFQNFLSPDYGPVQFFDGTGAPINLTGATFTFVIISIGGLMPTVITLEGDWTITDAANGKATFSFGLDDLAIVALFAVYITVQLPNESTPRAFPFNTLSILEWDGGPIVTTQVNVVQTVLPTNAAQENSGNLALIATRAASILAALGGTLVVNDYAASGKIAPAASQPAHTTANANTVYTMSAKGNHFFVQNNSPNVIYVELDALADLGCTAIAANGGVWRDDLPVTVFNIWSTAQTDINNGTANGIVARSYT